MTDKVQKIREEVKKLHGNPYYMMAVKDTLAIIDSLQEKPSKFDAAIQEGDDVRYNEDLGCRVNLSQLKRGAKKEEPVSKEIGNYDHKAAMESLYPELKEESVSDDFEMALAEMIDKAQTSVVEPWVVAAQWKDELIKLAKSEKPVSEDLEEASKEWLSPQLDKSYANYGEAKMMELTHFDGYAMLDAIDFGANWQKEHLMAKAVETTFNVSLPSGLYDKLWIKGCKDWDKLLVIKKDEL